uniref:Uncharacterized protein n=1 Tax=viral metagenome TaxID=1070528 RepID=A0A6C0HRW4_9ZZZZ
MDFTVTNTSRQYGMRVRDLKLQQIYSETITGEMVFDKSRLFLRSILPQEGTTLISVHSLQDVTDMVDVMAYPRSDDDEGAAEAIAKYHAIYGPYTCDKFEEKFNKLFTALKGCPSNLTGKMRKLDIIRRIYKAACESIRFIKEYSEQLLLLLYEDAYGYCDEYRDDYSNERADRNKTEALYYIHQYVEKVEELVEIYPHLIYRVKPALLDQFLDRKSYKHLRHGLNQFWIDPTRASIVAKHHDLYFSDIWLSWMTRNFKLPECICLLVIDWLLFAKKNTFMGETILGFLQRTHDPSINSTDPTTSTKIKRISRDVTIAGDFFLDIINVEIYI